MSTPKDEIVNYHDTTLIGENYFSYMLGLRLLAQGEQVLLIDDERVSYGEEFSGFLFEMDKSFLKSWGGIFNISALTELDELLSPSPYYLNFNNTTILLGKTPSENYRELQRKLPFLFPDFLIIDSTNDFKISAFIEKIANTSLQFKSFANFENEIYEEEIPEDLKAILDYSYDALVNTEGILSPEMFIRTHLRYSLNSFIFSRMEKNISKVEWTHIFFCLMGNRYYLEEQKLNELLSRQFIDRGGILKKTKVEEWQVYKGKTTCLQLASFEGVIRPGNVCFMGRPLAEIPLELKTGKRTFCSYNIRLELLSNYALGPELMFPHYIYYGSALGKDVPFFFSYPWDNRGLNITFAFPDEKGSKATFYLEQILEQVEMWLGKVSRHLDLDCFKKEIGVSADFNDWYIYRQEGLRQIFKGNHKGECHFQNANHIESQEIIKNIEYWGPMKAYSLGKSSFFMDLKSSIYGS